MQSFLILLSLILFSCGSHYPDYRGIEGIHGTLAYVYRNENGKAGLLDTSFKIILPAQFDYIENWQRDGLIRVDSGGQKTNCGNDCVGYDFKKLGLINTQGQILFRPQFDALVITDNSALVRVDSLFGYIDGSGKWLLTPIFKKAEPFYRGTAVVEDAGVYKLINKQGGLVTNQIFDTIWSFKNDVAVVEKNKKFGYINYKGKLILPLSDYRGIGDYNWYYGTFMKDEKWFVIDTTGALPISEGFDEVSIRGNEDSTVAIGIRNGIKVKVRLR